MKYKSNKILIIYYLKDQDKEIEIRKTINNNKINHKNKDKYKNKKQRKK